MSLINFYSLDSKYGSFYRRRDHFRCFLNKNDVYIRVTRLKERRRDTIWLLSKNIERWTHTERSLKKSNFAQLIARIV
jgi:hypothetical protein